MAEVRHLAEWAPAYELVLSLAEATSRAAEDAGAPRAQWVADAREAAGDDLLAEARSLTAGCEMVMAHLLSVAAEASPPRGTAEFVAALAATPALELRRRLLGHDVRWFRRATPPAVIAAAAAGDRAAAAEMLCTSYPDDEAWQAALTALLPLGVMATKRRVLALMRRWNERVWMRLLARRWTAILERRVVRTRAAIRIHGGEATVAEVTGGWEYIRERGIARLLLIPSCATRGVHVFDHAQAKFVVYHVEERVPRYAWMPPATLLRRLRAVAEDRRLRILRELSAGARTAADLAAGVNLPLTTLLHHLDVLREAGVIEDTGGRRRVYRLAEDVEELLANDLRSYLRG